jgi:Uma2 family endonuclease
VVTRVPTRRGPAADDDQCVELGDIGWKGYSSILRLRGDRPSPRIIYLDGSALLMSPSLPHEHLKERLGRFVSEVATGLRLPFRPVGQTTFRRRARRGGLESDHAYYIQNEALVRGKDRIDLRIDPAPDLAIEVVHTHDATAALEVYRRLRVAEVWICDRTELQILLRQKNGRYARSKASAAFPFLEAGEVLDWVQQPQDVSEMEWQNEVRDWVRDVLTLRLQKPQGGG